MHATINITPRAFGNIAARAIIYGLDVSSYLVRTAITAPGGAGQGSTTPPAGAAPAAPTAPTTSAPSPAPTTPAAELDLTC